MPRAEDANSEKNVGGGSQGQGGHPAGQEQRRPEGVRPQRHAGDPDTVADADEDAQAGSDASAQWTEGDAMIMDASHSAESDGGEVRGITHDSTDASQDAGSLSNLLRHQG